MKYKFKDGTEVDLERIISISPIRDLGVDRKSISTSKIAFSIHMDKHEVVNISREYHYSDWATVKVELKKEREDLFAKWNELTQSK